MNDTDESQIDAVLDNAVQRSRRGEVVDIEDYCRSHPALAGDLRLMLPALCLLEQPAIAMNATEAEVPIPTSLADFEVIREIGRGAMGIVYEAVQKSLGRRVALKLFRPSPESRKLLSPRFRREAETAARLHHSNIIPVFASGESDGCFFYAMQLIEGLNLQQLMAGKPLSPEAYVGQSEAEPVQVNGSAETTRNAGSTDEPANEGKSQIVARPFETEPRPTPQDCARIALQIAEGLSFAHQHGVIHRDIKPSNIILDAEGRAWIADFGLAKPEDGDDLTSSGNIVGTLRYLAPEGFQGQNGPRGDIYSLGLTLFELLEGRPAHLQNVRAQLINQVLHGPSPQLSRPLPTDLKTICHKCIEKDPGDRYQSAAILAEDLRRFLDGRPITSRVVGISEKMVRWTRRNPVIVSLVACLLVVGLVGAITAWSLSGRATRLSTESKMNFEQASQNLSLVLETVDRFCLTVSADQRLNRPEFKPLREQLLQTAVDFNNRFKGDPVVANQAKLQLARIYSRLGVLAVGQDSVSQVDDQLVFARNLLLELCEADGNQDEYLMELVRCERELAQNRHRANDLESAEQLFRSSSERADELVASVALAYAAVEKARTLLSFGQFLVDARRYDEAELSLLESVELFEAQFLETPHDRFVATGLANGNRTLGAMYLANIKNWKKAGEPLRLAAAQYEQLLENEPDSPDIVAAHAESLGRQSKFFLIAGDQPQSLSVQKKATDLLTDLVKEHESVIDYQMKLAIAWKKLAELHNGRGDVKLALNMLEQSGQVQSQIVAHDPGNSLNVIVLADIFLTHADALWGSKRYEQALEKVEQAIPLLDQLLVTSPENVLGAENRHFAAVKRAECLTKLGRFEDSTDEWTIALRLAPPMMKETTQVGTAINSILAGQFVEGTRLIDEILAGHDSDRPVQNQLLERCSAAFALAARQAWSQSNLPDHQATGEFYALRAIELLGQLQQRTGGTGKFIHESADLDVLRDRADFKALLAAAQNID